MVPCGRTDRDKDMMTLIVAFRNFAKAPTIYMVISMARNVDCVCMCKLAQIVNLVTETLVTSIHI